MLFISFLAWSFIVLVAALAIVEMKAPSALPANAPQDQFSAGRALNHIRMIAQAPHPLGSSANSAVRDYLLSQMSGLRLNPQVFNATGIRNTSREVVIASTHDLVGRLPGTTHAAAIMLLAHYDSVYRAPGASDDGAGVAGILETVRALQTQPPLKNDLIVLFTDAEESGLLGAEAFAATHPWMKDVGLILNFEARGNKGPSLLFETSSKNGALIKAVAQAAPHTIGSSLFYSLYKLLPNDTDLSVFRAHNIPGLNFAFGEGLEAYHSRLDTIDNLSPASLQHHGSYALNLTQYFGGADLAHLKDRSGDDIFFDWLGSHFVFYSESWVLPGQMLVTSMLICTIWLNVRRSDLRLIRLLLALLPMLAIVICIPAIMAAAWWSISRVWPSRMIIGDSPANSFLLAGLVILGACSGSFLFSKWRKYFSLQELSHSGLVLICFLSWLLALFLPGGSYLLFFPLLLAICGFLILGIVHKERDENACSLANLAGAGAAILLFAPIVYLLYIFLTLQLVTIIAIGFLLSLLFIISSSFINAVVPQNGRGAILATLFLSAVILIGTGLTLSHYSAKHPRPDSALYSLNADGAVWISYDRSVDSWTDQFFSHKPPIRQPMPEYLNGSERPVLSAPAPRLNLSFPAVEITMDKREGNLRTIQMNLRSQRNASALFVTFSKGMKPVTVKFDAREIPVHHDSGPFTITLLGMPLQSVALEIKVEAQDGISFWLMDRSFGLPEGTRPRPEDFMADVGSDVTLVCRKYNL